MTRVARLAAALSAAAVLIPAAAADAAPRHHASKTRAAAVGAHVKKAQTAQSRVARYAHKHNTSAALRQLKVARHEAVTAARQARAVAATAGTNDAATQQAVWSLTAAAGNYGDAIQAFANLLPQVNSTLQNAIAAAIPGSIAGRDQLVAQLSQLVDDLTGTGQSLAAQALAALQLDGPDQVSALANIADGLPASIGKIVDDALKAAASALDTGLQTLTGVVPNLPTDAQGPVATALQTVSQLISGLMPIVQNTTQAVVSTVQQVMSMVQNLIPQITGIFGFGNHDSSSSDDSSDQTSSHQGLLGGLLNIVPGVGNLLSGLLGNFLPGLA